MVPREGAEVYKEDAKPLLVAQRELLRLQPQVEPSAHAGSDMGIGLVMQSAGDVPRCMARAVAASGAIC